MDEREDIPRRSVFLKSFKYTNNHQVPNNSSSSSIFSSPSSKTSNKKQRHHSPEKIEKRVQPPSPEQDGTSKRSFVPRDLVPLSDVILIDGALPVEPECDGSLSMELIGDELDEPEPLDLNNSLRVEHEIELCDQMRSEQLSQSQKGVSNSSPSQKSRMDCGVESPLTMASNRQSQLKAVGEDLVESVSAPKTPDNGRGNATEMERIAGPVSTLKRRSALELQPMHESSCDPPSTPLMRSPFSLAYSATTAALPPSILRFQLEQEFEFLCQQKRSELDMKIALLREQFSCEVSLIRLNWMCCLCDVCLLFTCRLKI